MQPADLSTDIPKHLAQEDVNVDQQRTLLMNENCNTAS